jgi:hypothetical protein
MLRSALDRGVNGALKSRPCFGLVIRNGAFVNLSPDEDDPLSLLLMQPFSRVVPIKEKTVDVRFGIDSVMRERPKLAVPAAETITQFANLETMLGLSLAILFGSRR